MKRFLLALSALLVLVASCNLFHPVEPEVPDNPDDPTGTTPDGEEPEVTEPEISVEYEATDSLRIGNADFPYWAYDTTGIYGAIVSNTLLRKCRNNNENLGAAMVKESGSKTPTWGYWNYIVTYSSTDGSGNEVTLSERIVFPAGFSFTHSPRGIVLVSHPTIGANRESPTIDKDFLIGLSSLDYVIVFPDLMGFGVSQERIHPYMCQELTARQSIDGAIAAIRFLEDRGIELNADGGLINAGYSQGGASALAIHKYIETVSTEKERELLGLKASYCGGGPYDLIATWDAYREQTSLSFPCALPMTILAFKEGYPLEMKDIDPYDCLCPALKESDFLSRIQSKNFSVSLLNAHLKLDVGSTRMDAVLSPEMMDTESELHATIKGLLERNNLASGWAPEKPVFLYHEKKDEIVPYVNYTKALEGLSKGNVSTISVMLSGGSHIGGGGVFYLQLMDLL